MKPVSYIVINCLLNVVVVDVGECEDDNVMMTRAEMPLPILRSSDYLTIIQKKFLLS